MRSHHGILVLAFLFIGIFVSANRVWEAEAVDSPELWINADGSISPPTSLITTADNVTYTLADNIRVTSGWHAINILRDNIVLDGAGYTVEHTIHSGIILSNRNNVTVKNLRITNLGDAITLDANTWITVDNCTITGVGRGITNGYTPGPKNSTFTNNEIRASSTAISVGSISDCVFSGNTLQGTYGFWIWADNVTIKDNLVTGCSWTGAAILSASNVSIFNNTFSNNGIGITVGGVTNLTMIYHNRFINNNEHARGGNVTTLFWDMGYPSGGNYWGGFVSPDLYRGEYQNITGGDGIGDNPFIIPYLPYYVEDRYPLMLLGVTNVSQTPPMSSVLPNDAVEVNATVKHVYPLAQVILNCTYTNSSATWTSTINMTNLENDMWHGSIPSFPAGTNVTYAVTAYDDIGNSVSSEDQGYIFEYAVVPEPPLLLLLPALTAATLAAIIVRKRRRSVNAIIDWS
jgi:parallel beta-helix repeat protein